MAVISFEVGSSTEDFCQRLALLHPGNPGRWREDCRRQTVWLTSVIIHLWDGIIDNNNRLIAIGNTNDF